MDKQRRKLLQSTAILGIAGLSGALGLQGCDSNQSKNAAQNSGAKGAAVGASGADSTTQHTNTKGANMEFITLNNGVKMPILGYGVFQIEPKDTQKCVEEAISVGYRSIDTAQAYFNEAEVGAAVKTAIGGGVKREELFITTKVWINNYEESKALKSIETSLKKLQVDYLDLLLLHQPFNDVYGAWRAMSRLYKEGRIKALGVSNFYPDRLVDFCLNNEIKPAVNQIECSPLHAQFEAQEVLQEYGVAMESWAPFGEGKNNAQVILRWQIQRGIIAIPKTVRKERMIENFNVFDFSLSDSDMQSIAGLDDKQSLFFGHQDPKMVKWLIEVHKDKF